MNGVVSTKMTKGGQTTVPLEIREMLGISLDDRVYWSCDGRVAILSAEPALPLVVASEEDFWNRIREADDDIAAGRIGNAKELSGAMKEKYATL